MNFVIEQLSLLGLNGKEVRVFTTLSTFGRMNMTLLAQRAGLSRTTVDAIVRRLLKQGLIMQEKVAGHFEYKVELLEVSKQLQSLNRKLTVPNSTDEKIVTNAHNAVGETYYSIPSAFEYYKGERVRILMGQGDYGDKRATRRLSGYIGHVVRHRSKVEVVVSRHVAQVICAGGVKISKQVLPGCVTLTVVPTGHTTTHADILIFRDQVMIVDLLRGTIEHSVSAHLIEAMKHLFDIACEIGWSADLTEGWSKT